ncbi:MAG: glycoside hydrolase family 1 protein [bacterium]
MKNNLKFPKDFLWGASTSSYQVEGNIKNDWSEWEKSEKRKNQLEKTGMVKKYGFDNFICGRACDHYNRYEEDFDIAKSLCHNAHRFSIEWARIEPEEGKFDKKEIEHYREVIKALRKRNLEPFVTLWHFTNPLWLKNGWLNKKAISYFTRYVEKVVSELGEDVKFWITLNEPMVYSFLGYLIAKWPPQQMNPLNFFEVRNTLAEAHIKSYNIIKNMSPEFNIGIAKNNTYYTQFANWCPFEWAIKKILKYHNNKWFLNKIENYQDFIGLNYYMHFEINPLILKTKISPENRTDMGWEICPEGIYHLLMDLKKYNKPVYITENGIADARDEKRGKFIKDHLYWINRALEDGVDVKGYFYWSLLDNFEWAEGFCPKFGLVEIDYRTMERRIRESAYGYAKIIQHVK